SSSTHMMEVSCRWVLLHVQAAVDAPDLAGDVTRRVRGQEVHDARDLLGLSEASERDLADDLLEQLGRDVLEHLGGDEPGGHRVHGEPDPVGIREPPRLGEQEGGLAREGLGEAEEPRLGRRVVGLADIAHLADHARYVHDAPAPPLRHVPQGGLRQEEGPGEVDVEHLEPVLIGELEHRLVDGDARVVDEDVEPPVGRDHLVDGAPAVRRLAHVALVDAHLGAVGGGEAVAELLGRVVVPGVARGQDRALAGQASADGGPDPAGAAGDEGHAPLELVAPARGDVVVLGDVQDRGRGRHGRLLLDERLRPPAGTSWQIPIAESNGVQSPFVRLPIYYGWVVVAVVFVSMGIGVNARTAFSLLFPPILAEFGWERGVTAGAFSFGFLVSAALSPSLGRLMDRRGPRVVIELGVLLIGAGLLLATVVTRPWHLYATLGVMVGGGSVCLGYTGQSLFLPDWFVRRRGLAMSLAFSGVGVGSMILLPWIQTMIGRSGWRAACWAMGLLVLLLLVPLNLLLRRRPQDMGLEPDGDRTPAAGAVARPSNVVDAAWTAVDWTLARAAR